MIDPTHQPFADSSLQLARELRRAEREREDYVASARQQYDQASDEESRWEAATTYLARTAVASVTYGRAFRVAARAHFERDSRLVREAGELER